jgi:hypothetical protein
MTSMMFVTSWYSTGFNRMIVDLHICRNIGDVQRKFPKQNCTKDRVQQYIYPRALAKLLTRLQVPSASLEQYFKDDSLVRSRVVPNPPPIGEPILHLNR